MQHTVLFAINDSLVSTTTTLHIPEPSELGITAIFLIRSVHWVKGSH